MSKIPAKVAARISKNYNRMKKIVLNAIERDINEADTVLIVSEILANIYGYDKFKEITREFAIRNTFVDLAIQLDDTPEMLIEVKAIGIKLNEKHIKQAVDYGANKGIDWVILTNGKTWQVYKLRFEKPVSAKLIFQFNFIDLNARKQEDLETLFILCKEGIQKNAILDFSNYKQVVNKYFVASILQDEGVVGLVRRELNRMLPKNSVSEDEVLALIQNGVLKRDVIESDEAEKACSNYKKRKRKVHSKKIQLKTDRKEPQSDQLT
jgi:hypothetical protein